MRALCLHQNFVTLRQGGNSRAVQMIGALLERGWDVDLVTGARSYLDEYVAEEMARDGRLTILRVDVGASYLQNRRRGHLAFLWGALRASRSLARPDVVFATSPPPLQLLAAAWIALRHQVPVVVEVRDLWPAFLFEAGLVRGAMLRLALEWLESFSYRMASRLIAVTPSFGSYLRRLVSTPVHVLPTGSDPFLASMPREPSERVSVFYAGSLNEVYGVGTMLEAARLQPEIDFVIAGEGRQRDLVVRAAEELPNVRYVGLLAKDALLPLLARAGAGLVTLKPTPLLETIMPGKLFDYLAAGLPVICTVRGHAAQLVRDSGAGIVLEQHDAAALAAAAARMASMGADERNEMGARGRAYALSRFNGAALARETAAVVARAAEDRPMDLRTLLTAIAGAAGDVALRRPRRALGMFGDGERARVLEEAFAGYAPPQHDGSPIALPQMLSARGEAEQHRFPHALT